MKQQKAMNLKSREYLPLVTIEENDSKTGFIEKNAALRLSISGLEIHAICMLI